MVMKQLEMVKPQQYFWKSEVASCLIAFDQVLQGLADVDHLEGPDHILVHRLDDEGSVRREKFNLHIPIIILKVCRVSTSIVEEQENLQLQAKVIQIPPHLRKEMLMEPITEYFLDDPGLLVMHSVHRQQILISVVQNPRICCHVHEARLDYVAISIATLDPSQP